MKGLDLNFIQLFINKLFYLFVSYEDLVKILKPCDVVLERINDKQLTTLKVVDDPNRINDEPIAHSSHPQQDEEEEEEEIEIDLRETEAFVNVFNDVFIKFIRIKHLINGLFLGFAAILLFFL